MTNQIFTTTLNTTVTTDNGAYNFQATTEELHWAYRNLISLLEGQVEQLGASYYNPSRAIEAINALINSLTAKVKKSVTAPELKTLTSSYQAVFTFETPVRSDDVLPVFGYNDWVFKCKADWFKFNGSTSVTPFGSHGPTFTMFVQNGIILWVGVNGASQEQIEYLTESTGDQLISRMLGFGKRNPHITHD